MGFLAKVRTWKQIFFRTRQLKFKVRYLIKKHKKSFTNSLPYLRDVINEWFHYSSSRRKNINKGRTSTLFLLMKKYLQKCRWCWKISEKWPSARIWFCGKFENTFYWQELVWDEFVLKEYSGDLNSKFVWYSTGQNSLLVEWSVIQAMAWMMNYFGIWITHFWYIKRMASDHPLFGIWMVATYFAKSPSLI